MGRYLSKVNTLGQVDQKQLGIELRVRGIKCEIPGCDEYAAGISLSALAILPCVKHKLILEGSDTSARRVLELLVTRHLKHQMTLAAQAAYEGSEDELVLEFDGTMSLMDAARAALPSNKDSSTTVRRTLATLGRFNQIELPDIFLPV